MGLPDCPYPNPLCSCLFTTSWVVIKNQAAWADNKVEGARRQEKPFYRLQPILQRYSIGIDSLTVLSLDLGEQSDEEEE